MDQQKKQRLINIICPAVCRPSSQELLEFFMDFDDCEGYETFHKYDSAALFGLMYEGDLKYSRRIFNEFYQNMRLM